MSAPHDMHAVDRMPAEGVPPDDLNAPWHYEYAKTAQQNNVSPIYIVDCTGRKIGTVWGPAAKRELIAELWSASGGDGNG